MSLVGRLLYFIFERNAKKVDLEQIGARLEESRGKRVARFVQAADTAENREKVGHLIGIERWGQARLISALGGPLSQGEYDTFRPPADLSLPALTEAFKQTRAETLALIPQLQRAGVADRTIPHNEMGELSVKGWLVYFDSHGNREGMRL